MKKLILVLAIALFTIPANAQDKNLDNTESPVDHIFTPKEKNYIQYWFQDQLLTMDLDEDGQEGYLTHLNYYVYKMSKLGSSKYRYTNAERKAKFDELIVALNTEMQEMLSPANYKIHEVSVEKIKELAYDKKNW